MLHIGFDAKRIFHNFTGLGNYSRDLVENLNRFFPEHHYHLFSPKVRDSGRTRPFLNPEEYHIHTATRRPGSLWRTFGMVDDLKKNGIQLFHGLSHEIPVGIKKSGVKSVVSIHDLIFKKYPSQYGWLDRKMYDSKFRYACEHANRIIAISESTKQDIIEYYNISPEKIEVVYQSCHPQFFEIPSAEVLKQVRHKYRLPKDYLLYVGSIIPRKRLMSIVKALKHLKNDIPLIVIGEGKAYKKEIHTYIAENGLSQRVIFPQNIEFKDFPSMYHMAKVFIYPSIYEGFGIPIIESLYSKTPVITSALSSLPEAAGEGAMFVEPDNPEEIAHAIEKLLEDTQLADNLVEKGWHYVQKFNHQDISAQLMDLYHKTLGLPFTK